MAYTDSMIELYVVYPGAKRCSFTENVTVVPLAEFVGTT